MTFAIVFLLACGATVTFRGYLSKPALDPALFSRIRYSQLAESRPVKNAILKAENSLFPLAFGEYDPTNGTTCNCDVYRIKQ